MLGLCWPTASATEVRQQFIHYLSDAGHLEWQDEQIYRESSNYQNFFLISVQLVVGMIAVFLIWLVTAAFYSFVE